MRRVFAKVLKLTNNTNVGDLLGEMPMLSSFLLELPTGKISGKSSVFAVQKQILKAALP